MNQQSYDPGGPKPKMVRWYDPLLLLRTGIRSLLASSVGQITDNREMQTVAQRGTAEIVDYSARNDLWLDFIADTGDGYVATHGIARCLAADRLEAEDQQLPRASVVVCGGDLVYPDASIDNYIRRTCRPFQDACETYDFAAEFYAIPGNHDWYDGLRAFEDLFCHDDPDNPRWPLGNWRKPQTHSYCALHLPGNWWLLGLDLQLEGRINPSQRRFFKQLLGQLAPGARIIICTASPFWTHARQTNEARTIDWLLKACRDASARVELILAGDMHHYSHYRPSADDEPHLLTAGGGGAFLHPTHHLKQALTPIEAGVADSAYELEATYPTALKSRWLTLKNLGFATLNWKISLFVGFVYTLLVWLLETRFWSGTQQLSERFLSVLQNNNTVTEALGRLFGMLPQSPEFALVVLLTTAGLISFNQECTWRMKIILGVVHTIFHLIGLCVTYWMAVEMTLWWHESINDLRFAFLWLLLSMLVLGGGVGGTVFGLFLIVSNLCFKANLSNAFSAMRIAEFKNLLRLHIDAHGALTVYALGLEDPSRGDTGVHLINTINLK